MPSRLLSVVFTDIKGFTERTSQGGRDFAVKLREKHDALLRPIIARYEGTLVKTIGDAFLLTFDSPTNAVLCALMMQDRLRDYNRTAPVEERIEIRIAINTGEVSLTDGDVLGEPVNVASRVEHITEGNEIWFTEATYLAMNKQEVPTSLVGEFRLKGVPEALKIYRVVQDLDSEQFQKALANQQQKMSLGGPAPARALPLPVVILVTTLTLATALAILWTWKASIPPQLLEANRALNTGEPHRALTAVSQLLADSPNHAQGLELLNRSLELAVRQSLERNQASAARNLLDDYRTRFGSLGPLPDLEAEVTLAEAEVLTERGFDGKRQAEELLDRLAEEQKTRPATIERLARFYHRTGINGPKSVLFMHARAAFEPASFPADPGFIETMDYFLRSFPPDEGMDEPRAFIASHCLARFGPVLEQALATSDEANRALRWNALRILPLAGRPVDAAAVYRAEVLSSPGPEDSPLLQEAIGFFTAATDPASLPATLDRFPLFERSLLATDSPAMKLAAGALFPRLEAWLSRAMADPGSTTPRLNAFRLLAARGLPPDREWLFHAAQVVDWQGVFRTDNQTRQILRDDVRFLARQDPPPAATLADHPALTGLAPALAALLDEAKRAAAHAAANRWEDYQAFWNQVIEAGQTAAARIPVATR